jgi:hypothetical protein
MTRANSMAIVQDSPIDIKTALDNILSVCLRARRKPFGREPALWKAFEELSKHLESYASNRLTLKTKWSVGKGAWARVPWIALPDERETKSTRHGIYPVYLFREAHRIVDEYYGNTPNNFDAICRYSRL